MLQPVVGTLRHFTHLRLEEEGEQEGEQEEEQEGEMKVSKAKPFQFYLLYCFPT